MITPEQPNQVLAGTHQNQVGNGFRLGFGAVFGIIAAIAVIIFVIALLVGGLTYKTPYQKWSDCVTAQAENGNSNPDFVCGPQP